MIVTENIGNLIRHYSDAGLKLRQVETGEIYDDAIDIVPCPFTYEETDEPINGEGEGEEATAEDYEAALGEMGVGV